MTADDDVARLAAKYDPDLVAPTLRRLERRRARSGKVCSRCREKKPLSSFAKDAQKPDGLLRYCRPCDAERRARSV